MLQIQHLTFNYSHHPPILVNVNATFYPGTINLITGASGTGKSTLLKLMARLQPVTKHLRGQITYGPHKLSKIPDNQLSNYVAMMFQDPNRQFAMRTVKHEIIFTLENRRVPVTQIPNKYHEILIANHLTRFKNRKLSTLSGGEKQRVALAIITALNSRVILLDEPFDNVDNENRRTIMNKLVDLKQAGKTIIIVDHDLQGYSAITNQLLVLRGHHLINAQFSDLRAQNFNYRWKLPNFNQNKIYQLNQFTVGYQRPLIQEATLQFYAHRATLITGPNGSGKSTLFRALLKLIKYQGSIKYHQKPLSKIRTRKYYHHVNLIFQEATDQFLEITVQQELQLTWQHAFAHNYSKQRFRHLLKLTKLNQHLNQVVYSLSGGQKKALQIIEGLIAGCPVLLMDEPFQSLDNRLIQIFKTLLKQAVSRDHRTLIVISHQIGPVADLFDYHVQLANHHLTYQRGLHV